MRLFTLPKLLLLGGAVALFLGKRRSARRAGEPNVIPDSMDIDAIGPDDPVPGLDEVGMPLEELDFDARVTTDFEAAEDLAAPPLPDVDTLAADDGELYGVHEPRPIDRRLPDGGDALEAGENWIEALQASAVEDGVEPERELDVTDEVYEPQHRSDERDIPVADRGSGGPRGL